MIKYYSRNQLKEKATKKLVLLNNQKDAREDVLSLISNFLTYLKGIDAGYDPTELPFYSMFLIGSTGSGKSELVKRIAEISGLQTAVVDASSMTAAGFKGVNVANAVKAAIDGVSNPTAFVEEGGVIIFDETDKLACANSYYFESNPQSNLLKLLERDYILQVDTKDSNPSTIPMARILFVFTGAFSRLEPILKKKYQKNKEIGFLANESMVENKIDYMKYATIDDLCEFGMLRELMGRIGNITYIPPLDSSDFIMLMKSNGNSMQKIYKNMFKIHGVDFSISDTACIALGQEAQKLNTGARALQPLLRKYLAPAFIAIDENPNITSVVMDGIKDEIILNYNTQGKRDISFIADVNKPTSNHNLASLLKSESGIYYVCNKLVDMSELNSTEEKTAFFYLMQTFCRYLYLETNPEDQCYSSLIKLMKCYLKTDKNEDSIFDILMKDVFEKEANGYDILRTFFNLYNSVSGLPMTKKLLRELTKIQEQLELKTV